MLEALKHIPSICDIESESERGGWRMSVNGHPGRIEIIRGLLSTSLFLNGFGVGCWPCLSSLTLLLAAHPDIHDYALKLTPEGCWLNGYYGERLSAQQITTELEKQLSLTCYLKSVIRKHQQYCDCEAGL